MRRTRAGVVTTVSTVMLGAGWAAGVLGAAASSDSPTIDAFGTGGSTVEPSTSTAPATTASATAAADPAATAAADPAATDPAATSAAAPVAEPAPAPAGPTGTFDGALVTTREGNFQAEIVVSDGTITAVNVLVGGDNRRDSVQINQSALPTLQERVLSAQTWNVQGISGASYTVQGFLTSVKDAMSQAGLA